jgi:hypothetical protein
MKRDKTEEGELERYTRKKNKIIIIYYVFKVKRTVFK